MSVNNMVRPAAVRAKPLFNGALPITVSLTNIVTLQVFVFSHMYTDAQGNHAFLNELLFFIMSCRLGATNDENVIHTLN
ncbi:hypothetical protein KUL152_09350 [Tenacibaculum sp. KUL152]|nr:hypothetical protein KUL152_09350 [Tenacibaculum sp. KUL152]